MLTLSTFSIPGDELLVERAAHPLPEETCEENLQRLPVVASYVLQAWLNVHQTPDLSKKARHLSPLPAGACLYVFSGKTVLKYLPMWRGLRCLSHEQTIKTILRCHMKRRGEFLNSNTYYFATVQHKNLRHVSRQDSSHLREQVIQELDRKTDNTSRCQMHPSS